MLSQGANDASLKSPLPRAMLAQAALRSTAKSARERRLAPCAACLDKEEKLQAAQNQIDDLKRSNVRLLCKVQDKRGSPETTRKERKERDETVCQLEALLAEVSCHVGTCSVL